MAAKRTKSFWVVGGEYRDPNRYETVIGEERWIGPFPAEAEALKVWKEWAWKTVDHAQVRYRVVAGERPAAAAPGTRMKQQGPTREGSAGAV